LRSIVVFNVSGVCLGEGLDDAAAGVFDEDIEAAEALAREINGLFRRALIERSPAWLVTSAPNSLLRWHKPASSALVEIGKARAWRVFRQPFRDRKADALAAR